MNKFAPLLLKFALIEIKTASAPFVRRVPLGASFPIPFNSILIPRHPLVIAVKPLIVSIITPNRPLSTGKRVELHCHSYGSRPAAEITWYMNSKKLLNVKNSESMDGNMTSSTLSFIPSSEDNGVRLSCRATNLQINHYWIDDERTLTVHCEFAQVALSFVSHLFASLPVFFR